MKINKNKIQCFTDYQELLISSSACGSESCPAVTGPEGVAGSAGVDGASAYQVAVANGFLGTEQEWLQSLVGKNGKVIVNSIIPFSAKNIGLMIEEDNGLKRMHFTTNGFANHTGCTLVANDLNFPQTFDAIDAFMTCPVLAFNMPCDGVAKSITAELYIILGLFRGQMQPEAYIYISPPGSEVYTIVPESQIIFPPLTDPVGTNLVVSATKNFDYSLPIGTKVAFVIGVTNYESNPITVGSVNVSLKGNLIIETN